MSTDSESAYGDTYGTDRAVAKWSSAIVALLGLWLVAAPILVWDAVGADFWNDVVVGAAIVVLAAYSYYESSDDDPSGGTWASAFNALLGLWMIVAPFVWGVAELLFWNDVAVGALVAVIAGYAAFAGGESPAGLGAEQRT
ncbi:SPW repeat domain-containing protein [Halorussus sp. AFM4]|uniref:SPW repeat domain-containing protein n=1 Tax=Halorussus sp. AFM4 TaxID=3421651 RepID=UPI003EC0DDEE